MTHIFLAPVLSFFVDILLLLAGVSGIVIIIAAFSRKYEEEAKYTLHIAATIFFVSVLALVVIYACRTSNNIELYNDEYNINDIKNELNYNNIQGAIVELDNQHSREYIRIYYDNIEEDYRYVLYIRDRSKYEYNNEIQYESIIPDNDINTFYYKYKR